MFNLNIQTIVRVNMYLNLKKKWFKYLGFWILYYPKNKTYQRCQNEGETVDIIKYRNNWRFTEITKKIPKLPIYKLYKSK